MKGDRPARVILVTVRGRTKVSSRTDGKRQWRKERNIQRQDKQEIRGEFCTRDDISRTITGTLTIRHKQEREGRPLPWTERSLHHKERAGGCSIRTDGPSLAIVPPLHCQAVSRPCRAPSLMQSLSTLWATSKANKQGPPQYLRKQLFLPLEWGICWWGVSRQQGHRPPFKRSDKETYIPGHWRCLWPTIPMKFFRCPPPPT